MLEGHRITLLTEERALLIAALQDISDRLPDDDYSRKIAVDALASVSGPHKRLPLTGRYCEVCGWDGSFHPAEVISCIACGGKLVETRTASTGSRVPSREQADGALTPSATTKSQESRA